MGLILIHRVGYACAHEGKYWPIGYIIFNREYLYKTWNMCTVTERSKAHAVLDRLSAGIASSNPA